MNIIITAGGTSERIDDVRSITNTSTGRLGLAIGEHFLREFGDKIEHLYYLHGLRAAAPQGKQVKAIAISGVRELQRELSNLLQSQKIDAVVHAMAVSDYMVKQVTTLEAVKSGDTADLTGNKISSNIDDLTIIMERSPKVISSIKQLSPDTTLVGFKLLSHVPREELIHVGHRLLETNGCSFVLANDLAEIGGGKHRGYLIHRDKTYDIMEDNREIAAMIAKRVMEEQQAGKQTADKQAADKRTEDNQIAGKEEFNHQEAGKGAGMNIVLGVTGSIAAYKAAELTSRLTKEGCNVDVILTESGSRFITPLTLQTLSKNKVYMDMFEEITPSEVKHISLAKKADLLLIAPATANIIGKIAAGIADDFLSTVVMAAANHTPIYIAPAMNTEMYENPIVQENIQSLEKRGYRFIEPKASLLACGDLGKGALADVSIITEVVLKALK